MFRIIKDVCNEYRSNREELLGKKINFFWIKYISKKMFLPLIISLSFYFILLKYNIVIEHKNIATTFITINAISIALIVFSMTILMTKTFSDDIEKILKNKISTTKISTIKALVNNVEFSSIISLIAIFSNITYLYLANLDIKSLSILFKEKINIIISIFGSTSLTLIITSLIIISSDIIYINRKLNNS